MRILKLCHWKNKISDNSDSKFNICVKNIFDIWDKTKENKFIQLFFSNMSMSRGEGDFNIYNNDI